MKNLITTVFAIAAFAVVGVSSQAQNFSSIDSNSSSSLTFSSSRSNSDMSFSSAAPTTLSAAIAESDRQSVLSAGNTDQTTTADNSTASIIDLILGTGVAGAIVLVRRKRITN